MRQKPAQCCKAIILLWKISIYVSPSLPIHPPTCFPPWCLYVCSLCLCFHICFANKIFWGPRDCHIEWSLSKRQKQISYINAYMQVLENFTFLKWMMNYIISPGVYSHRRTPHKEPGRDTKGVFSWHKSLHKKRRVVPSPMHRCVAVNHDPSFLLGKCSPIRQGHKVNLC